MHLGRFTLVACLQHFRALILAHNTADFKRSLNAVIAKYMYKHPVRVSNKYVDSKWVLPVVVFVCV